MPTSTWPVPAVLVALLACAAPDALAQAGPQPIGPGAAPVEPARPTPLQGPRAPLPLPPSEVPIVVGVLSEVDPSVVGLLDGAHGGLGVEMWRGTSRARVEELLPRLPTSTTSPAMQQLMRRLLLSTAAVPEGTPSTPSLLGLRVERLMAAGRIADVNELMRLAATPVNDPALHRAEVDAMLLAGDYTGACQKVPALVQSEPRPYWLKTLAFCRALEQDAAAVTLATALLRDQGQTGDEAFFNLIAALPGGVGAQPVATLPEPTPLHLAMLRAANQRVPADAVAKADPAILWAIATAPKANATVPPEALEAAERAEAAGALATDVLTEIYLAVEYADPQIDDALNIAARERGPRTDALLYQAARSWREPARRAAALQAAWRAGRDTGTFATVARVNLQALRELTPSTDVLPIAADAVRAALTAGDLALAWTWAELALREAGTMTPQGGNADAIAATARLWPLLQMADSLGANSRSPQRARTWWQDLPKPADGADAQRRTLLFALSESLGQPVPPEAWEPLLGGPTIVTTTVPAPALAHTLADAAATKRVGETVLLALLTLGDKGPQGADAATLDAVIRALRTIGLEAEARAVAVEAALGHGL